MPAWHTAGAQRGHDVLLNLSPPARGLWRLSASFLRNRVMGGQARESLAAKDLGQGRVPIPPRGRLGQQVRD